MPGGPVPARRVPRRSGNTGVAVSSSPRLAKKTKRVNGFACGRVFSGRAWAPDSQTPTAAWHRGRSSLRHVGWCAQTNPTTHKTYLFLFLPSSSEPREARVAYTRGPFFLSLSPPKKPWATATVKPRPHNNISNTHRPSALHPQIRVLSSFPTSPRPSPPLFHFPHSHTFTAISGRAPAWSP